MTHSLRTKKRKIDTTVGSCSYSVPNPLPSTSSGDSLCMSHDYIAVLDGKDGNKPCEVFKQNCNLGDVWANRYPVPLSKFPKRTPATNFHYDSILHDLPRFGFRPLQVICKGRTNTIILVQDVTKGTNSTKECYPKIVKHFNSRTKEQSTATGQCKEAIVHLQLTHPNIVTPYLHLQLDGRHALLMEFCENGNLEQLLQVQDAKFIAESVARRYFSQIFGALKYLHRQNMAHRDICTRNILITVGNDAKLADFGDTVLHDPDSGLLTETCGSFGFQAPEIVKREPYNPFQVDMYSFGCVLYIMTVGKEPFSCLQESSSKLLQFPSEKVFNLSAEIKELLRGLLTSLPNCRFSLNRVRNSAWLQTVDNKVQIGNFYMIRQPQKVKEGARERQIKAQLEI